MTPFETMLHDLGHLLNIPLKGGKESRCSINVNGLFSVQIEEKEDILFLVAFLSTLSPGKFREEIFFEALKHNGDLAQDFFFGYVSHKNMLTLEKRLSLSLSPEEIKNSLTTLIDLGKLWKDSIDLGNLTPIRKPKTSSFISPLNLHP